MADLSSFRNIGIMAHIDAGKTTTTERILYYSGKSHKIGEVHDGAAVMDSMDQEQERGITIKAAATTVSWKYFAFDGNEKAEKECQINIIDTPGHIDFTVEVERSLFVLDGAVMVLCAVSGVESQSRKVWMQAQKHNVISIIFINKMDRVGADHNNVIEEIQSELGVEPLLIQIPIGTESNFRGVVDLVSYKAILWGDEDKGKTATVTDIPEEMLAEAENYRHHLLERISLESEALFEKFSQNPDDITQEEIIQAIRKGTITKSFVPIMLGSSLKNKGVQPLIDAIAHYLPSPLDMPDIVGSDPKKGDEVVRKQDPSEPFCALCFKTINDPHGQLTFMRIYSGTLHVGDTVYNPRTRKTGRMPSIVQIHSDKRTPIEKALAGTIVGVKGLKNAITGDTICDEKYPIVLQKMEFPEPVIGIRIEPKKQSDIKALGIALQRAIQADPSLKYVVDPESGETILKGMGELHLQVSLEEILRRDKIEVNQGDPQVAYREALNKTIEFRYIHKKQTGGRGQYADIKCKIGPITETDEEDNLLKGFVFINNIKGGNIPREFIPSVKKGFEEAMQTGPLKGYPLDSMQITLEDGSYHDVDSSQQAFETAAKSGYNKFAKDAHPILLEPIMLVEINVPSNYAGQVTGDLNGRRGQIMSMVSKGNGENIKATVPLGELNKYDSALRALTSGQAVASISFSSYKQVPPHILEGI